MNSYVVHLIRTEAYGMKLVHPQRLRYNVDATDKDTAIAIALRRNPGWKIAPDLKVEIDT